MKKEYVDIYADYNDTIVKRRAFTKLQARAIIESLRNSGCKNIRCNFNDLDNLY